MVDGNLESLQDQSWSQSGYVWIRELVGILNAHKIASSVNYSKGTNTVSGRISGKFYYIDLKHLSVMQETTNHLGQGTVSNVNAGYFAVLLCGSNNRTYVGLTQLMSAVGLSSRVYWPDTESDLIRGFVGNLNDWARLYDSGADATKRNWYVTMYIRQFNSNYVGGNWNGAGGKIDAGFINFANGLDNNISSFFTSATRFTDKFGNSVDVTHLAATMSALYYESTSADGFKQGLMPEVHLDNLAGWAGDLQQTMYPILKNGTLQDYDSVYNAFTKRLGSDEYQFPLPDLYADVDAVNLYDLTKSGKDIADVWNSYYSFGTDNRFNSFVSGITAEKPKTLPSLIFGYTGSVYLGFGWPLLNGESVSGTQRAAFTAAFNDFLISFIE